MVSVLCGCLALAWIWLRPNPYTCTLTDGSVVKLEAFAFGQNSFPIYFGSRVEKLLCNGISKLCGAKAGMVPGYTNMTRRVQTNSAVVSLNSDSLGLWISRVGKKEPPSGFHCVVLNENHEEIGAGGRVLRMARDSKGAWFTAWEFKCFPRPCRRVTLRLLQQDTNHEWHPVGEFVIKQKDFKDYPRLVPLPLPQTMVLGDQDFILKALSTGPGPGTEQGWARFRTRASLGTRFKGIENDFWEPTLLGVSDGTPNKYTEFGLGSLPGHSGIEFAGMVSTNLPLSLRFRFMKTAGFSQDEIWTLKDVTVPSSGETNTLNNIRRFGDFTVALSEFSTGFGPISRDENSRWSRIRADVNPRSNGDDHMLISLIAVTDGSGKNYKESTVNMHLKDWTYLGMFTPTDVTRATLTFAVHKWQEIEFVARPSSAK
ncbi:MAG TPA: hypothetical protein VMZ27_03195 [Candidatus Saccharimonadales bacterium]|nr:hypothetical protein [Candidatus Saccharimonadales bacterium]